MILNRIKGIPGLLSGFLLLLGLLFVTAACSGEASTATPTATTSPDPTPTSTSTPVPPTPVKVTTTTNIVADWVENIGGDHVDVFSLLPVGADPHGFQPGARDVANIADADLVLSIGLGLEESWMRDLLESAARDPSSITELGELIDPIEFAEVHIEEVEFLEHVGEVVHEVEEGEMTAEAGLEEIKMILAGVEIHEDEEDEPPAMTLDIIAQIDSGQIDIEEGLEEIEHILGGGEEEHEDHGHGTEDPHFWFDPIRVQIAVDEIVSLLSDLDPEQADTYEANASAFKDELDDLHIWTEEQVSTVPEENRLLVTSHDSLGYFAYLYGFEVVGVILSGTTEAEPSAEDLAELVHEIEETGAKAVFGETTVSERLASAVAAESGVELFRLYSGSLGIEGSGAETYITMVQTNVNRIVEALR